MAMFQLGLRFFENGFVRVLSAREKTPDSPRENLLAWKHRIQVRVVKQPRARRYLLRLQPDGTARLVVPRRGSRAEALRFLERSEAWLLQRHRQWQGRSAARREWTDGVRFLFRGEDVALRAEPEGDRVRLRFCDEMLMVASGTDYRKVVLAHLRGLAERELPHRTLELAREHGIAVSRVTVRAQKTRWGSCSARGTISLNWRLIQAPVSVRDYLIVHELMHRREMNHSRRYWKHVAAACPGYREAEAWLKRMRLEQMD
jgi:predicted metal-dependent hydrolase